MSISSETRKAGPYTGNGVTTALPFSFKVFSAADVLVVRTDLSGFETTLTLTTHYSVSLNPDQDSNPGGTVNLVTAAASSFLTTIASRVSYLQPIVFTNAGGFYPSVINSALDRLTILVQQVSEEVGRSVKVDLSSSTTPDDLMADISANVSASAASASSASSSAGSASSSATSASNSAAAAAASVATIDLSVFPTKTGVGASGTWGISITGSAANGVPVGTVIDFAGVSAPSGYLACPTAQTNISRATYAALFAAIGTTWGAGDGSTTFGMPYFPAGFAGIQNSGAGIGQSVAGTVQSHVHLIANPNAAASVGGAVLGASSSTGGVNSATGNNLAAGMNILKCVKY